MQFIAGRGCDHETLTLLGGRSTNAVPKRADRIPFEYFFQGGTDYADSRSPCEIMRIPVERAVSIHICYSLTTSWEGQNSLAVMGVTYRSPLTFCKDRRQVQMVLREITRISRYNLRQLPSYEASSQTVMRSDGAGMSSPVTPWLLGSLWELV